MRGYVVYSKDITISSFKVVENIEKSTTTIFIKTDMILTMLENNRSAAFESITFLALVLCKSATSCLIDLNEVSNFKLKHYPMLLYQEKDNRTCASSTAITVILRHNHFGTPCGVTQTTRQRHSTFWICHREKFWIE